MKFGMWIAAGLAVLSIAGCEKTTPGAQSTSAGGGTTPASGGKQKIVFIPKQTGNPYFDPVSDGVKKAADENGFDFATVGPDTAEATSQVPIIKDQVQQGVAAIVISANSKDALDPALDEARSKGVVIITADSDLTDNETHRDAGVLNVDPTEVGKGQLEMMGDEIGYKGKFAILSARSDAPNQNEWIDVMKKELASNPKYKDMSLVEVVCGNDEDQKSLTEAEGLLTKYPDLAGIDAPTSVGVIAACQAVETAKKTGKVQVTGLGLPSKMKKYVDDGTCKEFSLWDPFNTGYVAGFLAAKISKKEVKAEKDAKFTTGDKVDHTFLDKSVVYAGPPLVFTKDNIDKYKF